MALIIPEVLSRTQVRRFREALDQADWIDGRATGGHLSSAVKRNIQLPEDHPLALQLGDAVLAELERHPVFMSAALPAKMVPPLFNCYAGGQHYGRHIDGAVRPVAGQSHRVRTDLSSTLFLSDPEAYDGGELVLEELGGSRPRYKLAAGDLLLYPSTSLHWVEPVTRGVRIASFFWTQSIVRDNEQRAMLFALDNTIQQLRRDVPEHSAVVELTAHYHNLLRLWADV